MTTGKRPLASHSMQTARPSNYQPAVDSGTLHPLEADVLQGYCRLNRNLQKLVEVTSHLAASPSAETSDTLRELEKKLGLVMTLLKASVWQIVTENEAEDAA